MQRLRQEGAVVVALALVAGVGLGCRAPETALELDPASSRSPAAGSVVGGIGEYGAHVWRGLPYAQPPVGALRWRAPRALPAWASTREALRHGEVCPQLSSSLGGPRSARVGEVVGEEDCLSLDIYAPRWSPDEVPASGAGVPVLFWIHGGGNAIGTGSFYDGGNLAVTHRTVVVAINYRLGALGWMRHAALREGVDALDGSGNYGTLDMIRALEWVRDNVASFGGDSDNVTIFGESAGGFDVYTLLASPLAKGLFHRAIVQSGGLWTSTAAEAENFVDDDEPGHVASSQEMLVRLLLEQGRAQDPAGARRVLEAMELGKIAALMRARSAHDWVSAYHARDVEGLSDMPKVFTEGTVIAAASEGGPLGSFSRGAHNRVPVMVGTNRDENKLFFFNNDSLVRRWFGVIPSLRQPRLYHAAASHLSRMWKATGADVPADALAGAQDDGVFLYRWDWDEEPVIFGADLSSMLGAAHGLEIPFVFGHFDLGATANRLFTEENEPGRRELAHAMMSYWANFAYTGRPGRGRGGDLPEWPEWTPEASGDERSFLVFDTQQGGGIREERGRLNEAIVLAAVEGDERLVSQHERCTVLAALVGWGDLSERDYLVATSEGCAEYPLETYPWD